jgi:hypothetical protein
MSRGVMVEVHTLAHDVGEDLARLCGLEVQVEVHGGLDALVTQNSPHKFVFAGAVLEDESARRNHFRRRESYSDAWQTFQGSDCAAHNGALRTPQRGVAAFRSCLATKVTGSCRDRLQRAVGVHE